MNEFKITRSVTRLVNCLTYSNSLVLSYALSELQKIVTETSSLFVIFYCFSWQTRKIFTRLWKNLRNLWLNRYNWVQCDFECWRFLNSVNYFVIPLCQTSWLQLTKFCHGSKFAFPKGRFPLRKIVLGSDRIGTKFNLLMCLQCQFSVGLTWAVHRYKIASNWAKNWHRRRMFRLNFVSIRSDPRIIFLSGNQP